jgi:mono/diheme cytochrome c family protein
LASGGERVMAGLASLRGVRGALAASLLIGLAAGCEDRYPDSLHYPGRTDLIIDKQPEAEPVNPIPPGQLDASIAALVERRVDGAPVGIAGSKLFDPNNIPRNVRIDLNAVLQELFGTPANPRVDLRGAQGLQLDEETLAEGSRHYRRNCLHCHGLAGDGRGPTGPWVNPSPRDYRQGLFKFVSTKPEITVETDEGDITRTGKARLADLIRTISTGIDGTSMPAFNQLNDLRLNQIARYVLHLSLRGQAEMDTMMELIGEKTVPSKDELAEKVRKKAEFILNVWLGSNKPDAVNKPASYPYKDADLKASIVRGYKLFTNPEGEASCIKCHNDFGRQVNFKYDAWGTLVRPANLTNPTYRGGRRPIDIYWRITGGIPPSGMPAGKGLGPKDYWDVINFVQALPYPNMLPEEIRDKIYVPSQAPSHAEGHASRGR